MKGQVSSYLDPTTITRINTKCMTRIQNVTVFRAAPKANRHTNLHLTFLLLFLFYSLLIPQHFSLSYLTKNTQRAREKERSHNGHFLLRRDAFSFHPPPLRLLRLRSRRISPPHGGSGSGGRVFDSHTQHGALSGLRNSRRQGGETAECVLRRA